MRYLERPTVDDLENITTIAENTHIPVANRLIFDGVKNALPSAYKAYLKARGCPVSLLPIAISNVQKERLRSLYSAEVVGLEFIDHIRHNLSPEVCPMCGKPSNGGEVDHFIEKHSHPEFSFFSANLVPACKCNGKRKECLLDGVRVRPLHPYFDKILRRRLIRARFAGVFANPSVEVVAVGGLGALRGRVEAHIRAVVVENGIEVWLAKQWELLLLDPRRLLALPSHPLTMGQLARHLRDLRTRADLMYGSMNGWEAAWFSGLIANPGALRGVGMLLRGMPVSAIPSI